ncbi:MAG TPA: DUF4132 domain-containing protein [Pyrinomonadaceae bacterium]
MSQFSLKNETGLSEEQINSLIMDFRRLESFDSELPEKIVRYVIDGEEPGFPATLQMMLSNKTYSGIKYEFSWNAPHGSFFRKYDLSDPNPLFRLAQVYDTIFQHQTLSNQIYNNQNLNFKNADLTAFTAALIHAFQRQNKKFPIELLDKVFELASEESDSLARIIYINDSSQSQYSYYQIRNETVQYKGFAEFTERHAATVREALRLPKAEQRVHALEILSKQNVPALPFVGEIAPLACSSAKTERSEASFLLKKCGEKAIPHLQEIAVKGNPTERANAVKLLYELSGETSNEFLKSRLETDKSSNVRDTIDELLNQKPIEVSEEGEFDLTVPPPPQVNFNEPLSKSFFSELQEAIKKVDVASLNFFESSSGHWKPPRKPEKISQEKIEKFFELLQNGNGEECRKFRLVEPHYFSFAQTYLNPIFVASTEIKPIHIVRLALLLQTNNQEIIWTLNNELPRFQANPNLRIGLRELSQIFVRLKISDNQIVQHLLHKNQYYDPLSSFHDNDENVWQFLFDKQDDLEKALYANEIDKRQNALELLAKFPKLPPRFRPKLWEFAFGKAKGERFLAQKCLVNDRQKKEKLLDALKSRVAETRGVAAEWWGSSGDENAIEPLREAIEKEKSDVAKDQMLRALERLGASVEEYLDRDQLAADAKTNIQGDFVRKTIPWLNASLLPKVRWVDTGQEVLPEVLTWFIVQSVRQKQVEPSPLLRRYLEKIEKQGRERFAQFVLESWIGADTEPFPPDEAEAKAKAELASAKNYWQYYQTQGYTEDSYFQQQFNHYLKRPKGSAIKEKGILAITAAAGGAAAVPLTERYIREFHGHRLKQSLALVEILGELNDLNAVQVLLSLANRFRTKGIQEEAKRQVDLLAKRNGWTLDELADRTLPTLGFNEKGELHLDYGSRKFIAKLDKDFNFLLFDEQNKKIKSLPMARKEDDPELVKDAKQTFANAKKNLKQILSLQKERLYEAMCSGRSWKFVDWQTFLNGHPILRRYCQTLVWQTTDETNQITFRPLDDGSLTDAEDNEVELESETLVKLVHQQTIPLETAENWKLHLSDYEITPIFPQFGREMPGLSKETMDAREIKDFEGWMIETFKLRGKATALGFTRGSVEDAGCFYNYRKSFTALELEAFIEFTGSFVPEENRPAALLSLSFARIGKQTSGYLSPNSGLKIKDVPPVVLCEVWNDWKTIANTGTGFDPDWKKKSEY